jgi:uncharacterized protein (DUF2267 family)
MDHEQTGVDRAADQTEKFFRDIEQSGALPDGVSAIDAVAAVLCTLTMRLSGGEARDFAGAVPRKLRRILNRCAIHREEQPEKFDRRTFLRYVGGHLEVGPAAAERLSRVVFAAVRTLLPEDEILDVESQLPRDLVELWNPIPTPKPFDPTPTTRERRPVEEPSESIFRELERSGVLPDGIAAITAVGAVLCTLEMQLTRGEARELAELAPPTLRTLLDRCPRHVGERPATWDRATFLRYVGDHLGLEGEATKQLTRAVFAAVRARIPPAEIKHVDSRLPRDLLDLWQRSE